MKFVQKVRQKQQAINDSDNGLALNSYQAIIWANNDPDYWHHSALMNWLFANPVIVERRHNVSGLRLMDAIEFQKLRQVLI